MQITCKELSFYYNKNTKFAQKALDNVSFTIDEGDFFGIIGKTGSGKSTLIQHLNGLIPVQEGELCIGEFKLNAKNKELKKIYKQLRANVGMVFQYPEYQLFADTVYMDVAFGIKNFYSDYDEKTTQILVRDAIEKVGLNYDEVKNKSPFEISGGQRRRVAIAGVIVTKPQILVLDEPVAGLDPIGKKELMKLLHSLLGDVVKTIIIVSHDMNEVVENCNKIAVMDKGKIVKIGTPKQIFTSGSEIENLRLELPDTAYIQNELSKNGIEIPQKYDLDEFVEEIVKIYK